MLNQQQRNKIRDAQETTGISRQAWLAQLVRQADHGDEEALKKLKLFIREYNRTSSARRAQGAVMLHYNQMKLDL